jgi:hypothetical protein
MPASLEKLALGRLKSSKLVQSKYDRTQAGRFLSAYLTCFSVRRTRSVGCRMLVCQQVISRSLICGYIIDNKNNSNINTCVYLQDLVYL